MYRKMGDKERFMGGICTEIVSQRQIVIREAPCSGPQAHHEEPIRTAALFDDHADCFAHLRSSKRRWLTGRLRAPSATVTYAVGP